MNWAYVRRRWHSVRQPYPSASGVLGVFLEDKWRPAHDGALADERWHARPMPRTAQANPGHRAAMLIVMERPDAAITATRQVSGSGVPTEHSAERAHDRPLAPAVVAAATFDRAYASTNLPITANSKYSRATGISARLIPCSPHRSPRTVTASSGRTRRTGPVRRIRTGPLRRAPGRSRPSCGRLIPPRGSPRQAPSRPRPRRGSNAVRSRGGQVPS
jgi:hypothetical protein